MKTPQTKLRGPPFERLVAAVQSKLDATADVEWNKRIRGKSGLSRQIDVAIKGRCGSAELLIAIEAKDYSRDLVSIELVEAFATKLDDIQANKGIMVTTNGYTRDALMVAQRLSIDTCILRPANDADWKGRIRSASAQIILMKILCEDAELTLRSGETRLIPQDGSLPLEDDFGTSTTIAEIAVRILTDYKELDGRKIEGEDIWFEPSKPRFFLLESNARKEISRIKGRFSFVDGATQEILMNTTADWIFTQQLLDKQVDEKHFFEFAELERIANDFKRRLPAAP